MRGLAESPVFDRSCKNCGSSLEYDGRYDTLFTIASDTALSYDLLAQYDCSMESTAVTFTSFVAGMSSKYSRHYKSDFISKQKFISTWWSWNASRDLDFDLTFTCPECSLLPLDQTVWTFDATMLGIQKTRFDVPDHPPPSSEKIQGWCVCLSFFTD